MAHKPNLRHKRALNWHAGCPMMRGPCYVENTANRARWRPKSVSRALIRLAGGFLRHRAVKAESGRAHGTCGLVPSVEIRRPQACSRPISAWNRTAEQPARGYLPETRQSDTDTMLCICYAQHHQTSPGDRRHDSEAHGTIKARNRLLRTCDRGCTRSGGLGWTWRSWRAGAELAYTYPCGPRRAPMMPEVLCTLPWPSRRRQEDVSTVVWAK